MYFITIITVLCARLCIGNSMFATNHDYILEKFRKSAEGLDSSNIEEKWIKQPVDHFNKSDTREWNMRYFQNLEKWIPGGPMYVFINGEGKASSDMLLNGFVHELAVETNGAMWATEHRYYGDSQPFDTSTTENLKYLSSKQALADIAKLIRQLKLSSNFKSSKVVVAGGSYAGNLAAWMRRLYPGLVDAAISSSAPVLAKVNYFEYLETVGDDFKKYTRSECFDQIAFLFEHFMYLLSYKEGIDDLKKDYHICEQIDMNKPENQAAFFMYETSAYSAAAQYGSTDEIKDFCNGIDIHKTEGDYKVFDEKSNCLDLQINCEDKRIRSWLYQTCTEFGYFQTTPRNEPFHYTSIDINYYSYLCRNCFGINETETEEGVRRTNELYGGLNPNVTNVVFVNGEIDPWHRLGILKDLSDTAPARIIPRATHCSDLYSYRPNEHIEITAVQKEEKDFIKKWIGLQSQHFYLRNVCEYFIRAPFSNH